MHSSAFPYSFLLCIPSGIIFSSLYFTIVFKTEYEWLFYNINDVIHKIMNDIMNSTVVNGTIKYE